MEIPTQVELSINETYTLELQGLGAAGYLWIYEILENSAIVDISSETNPMRTDNSQSLQRVGSSVDEIFIIKALKFGHSRIRFIQRRPWEPNQPPLKEHIIKVKIHK